MNLKPIFSLLFFDLKDFSLNMLLINLKLYRLVEYIYLEGMVSQILYLGLSSIFMLKKREVLGIFSHLIFYI